MEEWVFLGDGPGGDKTVEVLGDSDTASEDGSESGFAIVRVGRGGDRSAGLDESPVDTVGDAPARSAVAAAAVPQPTPPGLFKVVSYGEAFSDFSSGDGAIAGGGGDEAEESNGSVVDVATVVDAIFGVGGSGGAVIGEHEDTESSVEALLELASGVKAAGAESSGEEEEEEDDDDDEPEESASYSNEAAAPESVGVERQDTEISDADEAPPEQASTAYDDIDVSDEDESKHGYIDILPSPGRAEKIDIGKAACVACDDGEVCASEADPEVEDSSDGEEIDSEEDDGSEAEGSSGTEEIDCDDDDGSSDGEESDCEEEEDSDAEEIDCEGDCSDEEESDCEEEDDTDNSEVEESGDDEDGNTEESGDEVASDVNVAYEHNAQPSATTSGVANEHTDFVARKCKYDDIDSGSDTEESDCDDDDDDDMEESDCDEEETEEHIEFVGRKCKYDDIDDSSDMKESDCDDEDDDGDSSLSDDSSDDMEESDCDDEETEEHIVFVGRKCKYDDIDSSDMEESDCDDDDDDSQSDDCSDDIEESDCDEEEIEESDNDVAYDFSVPYDHNAEPTTTTTVRRKYDDIDDSDDEESTYYNNNSSNAEDCDDVTIDDTCPVCGHIVELKLSGGDQRQLIPELSRGSYYDDFFNPRAVRHAVIICHNGEAWCISHDGDKLYVCNSEQGEATASSAAEEHVRQVCSKYDDIDTDTEDGGDVCSSAPTAEAQSTAPEKEQEQELTSEEMGQRKVEQAFDHELERVVAQAFDSALQKYDNDDMDTSESDHDVSCHGGEVCDTADTKSTRGPAWRCRQTAEAQFTAEAAQEKKQALALEEVKKPEGAQALDDALARVAAAAAEALESALEAPCATTMPQVAAAPSANANAAGAAPSEATPVTPARVVERCGQRSGSRATDCTGFEDVLFAVCVVVLCIFMFVSPLLPYLLFRKSSS